MRRNKQKGFTLTELIVVVAIIGLLMSFFIVSTTSYSIKISETQIALDLNTIETAIKTVLMENGGMPKGSSSKTGYDMFIESLNANLPDDLRIVQGNGTEYMKPDRTQESIYSQAVVENRKNPGEFISEGSLLFSKKDPWSYNYSLYFDKYTDKTTGDKVEKIMVTSWGKIGREREMSYILFIESVGGELKTVKLGLDGLSEGTLICTKAFSGSNSNKTVTVKNVMNFSRYLIDKSDTTNNIEIYNSSEYRNTDLSMVTCR